MKTRGHWLYLLVIALPLIAIAGAIIINELYKSGTGYLTVWSGAEILSYFGAVLSALGSATIGIVAWYQNKRILQVQEESFLVQNYSTVLVDSIRIQGFQRRAGTLELYDNPIVATIADLDKAESISITVKMIAIDSIPALIRIKSVFLFVYDETDIKTNALIDACGIDTAYSRVAVSKDKNAFVNILLLLSNKEKKELKVNLYNKIVHLKFVMV